MYAKIENGNVVDYPLFEGDVERLTSGFIFPLDVHEEVNANNNGKVIPDGFVKIVPYFPIYDDYAFKYVEVNPTFDQEKNAWIQTYEKIALTEEELNANEIRVSSIMRNKRDEVLAKSDIYVVIDKWEDYTEEEKLQWKYFRKALRDIPEQEGFPYSVVWPESPEGFSL